MWKKHYSQKSPKIKYGTAHGLLCWINKATNIYSEYVIIIAFPRHKLLHERLSCLRLYVYCPYFSILPGPWNLDFKLFRWWTLRKLSTEIGRRIAWFNLEVQSKQQGSSEIPTYKIRRCHVPWSRRHVNLLLRVRKTFWDFQPLINFISVFSESLKIFAQPPSPIQRHYCTPVFVNRRPAARYRPWHQLYRAARGSPGICHFRFLSNFSWIDNLLWKYSEEKNIRECVEKLGPRCWLEETKICYKISLGQ